MCDIILLFSQHLQRFGDNVHVILDGYECVPSIKDHEHSRRGSAVAHVAAFWQLNSSTKDIGAREPFLANINHKKAFVKVLVNYLRRCSVHVYEATDDADTVIASTALQLATLDQPVVLFAEDTDILALLLHHRKHEMADIYFMSDGKRGRGGERVTGKTISVTALQNKIGYNSCVSLPAIHAFGGCDTTSAIFGHGEGAIFSKIATDSGLREHCRTLQCETATVQELKSALLA